LPEANGPEVYGEVTNGENANRTATVGEKDFAAQLERAIERSRRKVVVIEAVEINSGVCR
jgi:hypothetical protein